MEIKLNIDEILEYTQPTKFIAKEIIKNGNTPVLTANKSFVIGYTNEKENIFSNIPCIIFDDFTCDMKYVDFPFKIRSSALKILNLINDKNNIKYVYELIKRIKFDNNDHKRYWISEFSKQQISLIDINKQKMIGEFLSIFDKKINLIKKKILNKIEYKNKLINIFFNTLRAKENFLFSDIFKKYSQKNIENFKQYTIGKNGIKEFPDLRHKINNHNVFFKNDLIIGLGIEEVNINIDIEKGSCSPIYTIYSSNPKLLNINYGYYFIPFYLKKIKNSISKKSSRREFEIISFELNKIRIPLINNREQKIISDFLLNIDKEMEFLKKELILNIKHKKSILNKIFK